MAYTSADLTAIRTAIASGELEVEFGDRRVRYRSMPELLRAEARVSKAITIADSTATQRPKGYRVNVSKGI